jgi:hypothetical protein
MSDILEKLDRIKARISTEGFLRNKGLGNEVGIHVFCYGPADEPAVRAGVARLKADGIAHGSPRRFAPRDDRPGAPCDGGLGAARDDRAGAPCDDGPGAPCDGGLGAARDDWLGAPCDGGPGAPCDDGMGVARDGGPGAARDDMSLRATRSNPVPYRIVECDLYEIFLGILESKRALPAAPALEEKRGKGYLLDQLQKAAPPEAYIEAMKYEPHTHGDVLFLTGVGAAYPFMRSHNILNGIQHIFADVPIVMFYPGTFDGQDLGLFGKFLDGHYYRAFDLL